MKLNEFTRKDSAVAALKENFQMDFNPAEMKRADATRMLGKVRKLIAETKISKERHDSHKSSSYLKLTFMEQALSSHLGNKSTRIVVENIEVERSQVILAAQDLIDSVQKMYEDVNDILVKELPALVSSIQSEIGVNESRSFNDKATETLNSLNSALQESRSNLQSALDIVTGNAEEESFDDMSDADMDLELDDQGMDDLTDLPEPEGDDFGDDNDVDFDETQIDINPAGRTKR